MDPTPNPTLNRNEEKYIFIFYDPDEVFKTMNHDIDARL